MSINLKDIGDAWGKQFKSNKDAIPSAQEIITGLSNWISR